MSSLYLIRLTEREPRRTAYRFINEEVAPEINFLLSIFPEDWGEIGKITFVKVWQKNTLK